MSTPQPNDTAVTETTNGRTSVFQDGTIDVSGNGNGILILLDVGYDTYPLSHIDPSSTTQDWLVEDEG